MHHYSSTLLTPGIVGAHYSRDVSTIVNASEPPDRAQLSAVMSEYGLVPAPPR